jgi:hypothetical protein
MATPTTKSVTRHLGVMPTLALRGRKRKSVTLPSVTPATVAHGTRTNSEIAASAPMAVEKRGLALELFATD